MKRLARIDFLLAGGCVGDYAVLDYNASLTTDPGVPGVA
jgi:hypothetical protein